MALGEILFEFYRVGNAVKVSAVDPVTGTEVSVVGSTAMSELALRTAAARKLKYVIEKNAARNERASHPSSSEGNEA